MTQQSPFKWRHFEADIILLCALVSGGAPCHGLQYPALGRKNREEVLWVNGLPRVERQRGQEHARKARRGQSVVATGLARPARQGESWIA